MASDVRNALVQIMAAPSHLNSHDAAVKKLADMQLKGRYLQVPRACSASCAFVWLWLRLCFSLWRRLRSARCAS
jgi:hypothetical protein